MEPRGRPAGRRGRRRIRDRADPAARPARPDPTGDKMARAWVVSRWLVVVASLFAEICGGAMYAFPVYSESLRSTLGYTQTQVRRGRVLN